MEVGSKYPDIPCLEEPVIWHDDSGEDLSKLWHMFQPKETSVAYELEPPAMHSGNFSQGTYNEWFEELLIHPDQHCSTEKTADMVIKEISTRRAMSKQRDKAQEGADIPSEKATPLVDKAVIFDESPRNLSSLPSSKATGVFDKATSPAEQATPMTGKAVIWDKSPNELSFLQRSKATLISEKAISSAEVATPIAGRAI